jgi:hypothetical protein
MALFRFLRERTDNRGLQRYLDNTIWQSYVAQQTYGLPSWYSTLSKWPNSHEPEIYSVSAMYLTWLFEVIRRYSVAGYSHISVISYHWSFSPCKVLIFLKFIFYIRELRPRWKVASHRDVSLFLVCGVRFSRKLYAITRVNLFCPIKGCAKVKSV